VADLNRRASCIKGFLEVSGRGAEESDGPWAGDPPVSDLPLPSMELTGSTRGSTMMSQRTTQNKWTQLWPYPSDTTRQLWQAFRVAAAMVRDHPAAIQVWCCSPDELPTCS